MKIFKSIFVILLVVVLLWNNAWISKPTVQADSDAANGIILTMSADAPVVDSGKTFTYDIKFSFSGLAISGLDFNDLTLELPVPVGVQFLDYVSIPVIDGMTRNGGTVVGGSLTGETLRFSFDPTVPAEGDSYTLQVNAKYVPFVTPNGMQTTTAATMIQAGVSLESSEDVTVTAQASSAWHIEKRKISPHPTPLAGGDVQYEILLDNDKSASELGVLDIENVTVTDALPPGSVYVASSNGGVYDSGAHTVEWTTPGSLRNDTRYYVTVNYPSPTFTDASSVTNTVLMQYNELGNPATLTDADSVTHGFQSTPQDDGLGGVFYKNRNVHQREISKGQEVTFTIGGFHNYSNSQLTDASIVDLTPTEDTNGVAVDFDVKSVKTAIFRDAPSVTYSVYYATNALADDWTSWQDVSSVSSQTLNAADLGLTPGTSITGIKFTFDGTLPISFTQLSDFELTYTLNSAYPVIASGQRVVNTADVYYKFEGLQKHYQDSADVYLWGERPLVELRKTRVGPQANSPEQEIAFQIRVSNTELSSDFFNNPIVMDELPESLTYVAGSAQIVDASFGLIGIGAIADPTISTLPGDKHLMTWSFPMSMPASEYFTIQYKAKVNKFATPGTYINYAEVTTNTDPYFNDYWFDLQTDTADHDGDGNSADKLIRSEAQFTVNQIAALGSYKRVRGELDDDWALGQYPAGWKDGDPVPVPDPLGNTVAGGRVDYKLTVYNKGNVPLDHIVLVDVLPRIGDEGALLGARGTTWNTVLTDALPANADYTVWYSTDAHPKMTGSQWDTTPPADLTTVTGLKFVFTPALQLAPDEKRDIIWSMKAPVGTPITQIAWNSFGQQASIAGGGSALSPAEPPKVGVHIMPNPKVSLGNYVWVDLNRNGIQDEDLAKWGLNGVRVDLMNPDGITPYTKTYHDDGVMTNVPIFTVTGDDLNGNPGYYEFSNMDAGTYKVKFTLPSSLPTDYEYAYGTNAANRFSTWTLKTSGGDAELDSNVGGTLVTPLTSATAITDSFTLGASDDLSIDAGVEPPLGAIGNYVWEDADADGIQDAGESPIAGVQVQLLDESGNPVLDDSSNPLIETTDGSGLYAFTGLLPGKYKVKFPEKVGPVGNEKIVTFKSKTGSNPTNDSNPNAAGLTDVIELQLGEINNTIDAGYVAPVSLGDLVWIDGDYDGVQGGGTDAPATGVTVRLLDGSSNPVKAADGTTNRTFTTAADGKYLFDYLLPGTYKVEFQLPAGYGFTRQDKGSDDTLDSDANRTANLSTAQTSGRTANYALTTPGTVNLTADAGLVQLGSLGDFVWIDKDADGIQDAGESGIAGATVNLYYDDDSTTVAYRTATTPASGAYAFNKLYPGKYTVEIVRPNGYLFSPKSQGGDTAKDADVNVPALPSATKGKTSQFTLLPGEDNPTIDSGLIPLASVGDFVWRDANDDGIQSGGGESGVAGIAVTLLDSNGDPVTLDAYGQAIATITTPASGAYLFSNLLPGDYTVKFELPVGSKDWFTTADAGADDAKDSDGVEQAGGKAALADVTLGYGDNNLTIDAGIHTLASLGDKVWLDADGDGIQDGGETGVDGIVAELYNAAGTVQITTDAYGNDISNVLTAGGGLYRFDNLLPGTYRVKFSGLPAGYEFTLRAIGAATADSDANPNQLAADFGMTAPVALAWSEENVTLDAGIVTRTQIGDFVWLDLDGDGVQDAGEPGVENVTVSLLDDNGDPILIGGDPLTQTTDADGKYLFPNLWPGDFKVKFDLPSDYYSFSPKEAASGTDATDSDADLTTGISGTITLVSGDDIRTVDAGLIELVSIGDLLWDDLDGDGVQDAGEPGYAGMTVNLLDGSGNPVLSGGSPMTDTTDADGKYLFEKLAPGSYKVKFQLPTGYMFSEANAGGSTAGTDSDVNPADGVTAAIALPPTTHDMTVDAGIVKLASLGDFVWMDRDLDGIQNNGESGVAGATVLLLDALNNTLRTATTDADGKYLFADLPPGTYKVQFDAIAGYARTQSDAGADGEADSDANTATGQTVAITLSPGEINRAIDSGFVKLADLGDTLWLDTGAIGVQEGEPAVAAIAGVTVRLLDGTGNPVLNGGVPVTTVTDATGTYSFNDLYPGAYKVKFDLPGGYLFTQGHRIGAGITTANDSNVDAAGVTDTIILTAGADDPTVDAGIVVPASIGNYVWEDTNGDGIQDATEEGLDDLEVKLLTADGTEIASTTTATNAGKAGYYAFASVIPGTYKIKFEVKPGYRFTLKGAGGAATNSDADMTGISDVVTLQPGENNVDLDAGMLPNPPIPLAKLGDYVWIDRNADGIQDSSESGINDVTVELYNSFGARIQTVVTANDPSMKEGYYLFESLLPGSYTVKFYAPDGYMLSPKGAGESIEADSDADRNGETEAVYLFGTTNLTVDAGLVPLASLGDRVWIDEDQDGKQDAAEVGLNGIRVTLIDESGTKLRDTMTADSPSGKPGYYEFGNLVPGSYAVRFDLPEGYAFSKAHATAAPKDSDAGKEGLTATIALAPGERNATIDAGVHAEGEEPQLVPDDEEDSPPIGDRGSTGTESSAGSKGGKSDTSTNGGRGDNKSGIGLTRGGKDDKLSGMLPKTGESDPLLLWAGYALMLTAAAGFSIRWVARRRNK